MRKVKRLFRDDVEIDQIDSSPFQPRLEFKLENLKEQIVKEGILVPLMVRLVGSRYELIDGERRWRLAKELDYKTVVCDVVEADDEEADDWIWELNESRESYEPKERALRYKRFQDEKKMSLREIAKKHNEAHITVRSYLGIFKLPVKYQELVWSREIKIRIIREILPLLDEEVGHVSHQVTKILDKVAIDPDYGLEQVREKLGKVNKQIKQTAKKVIETITDVKIETPEDYEKAAKLLKREAEKKREAILTPKERIKIEAEKQKKEKEKKLKDQQRRQEKKKKEEKKIRKQAEKIKVDKLLEDPEHLKKAHKEYKKLKKRLFTKIDSPELPKGEFNIILADPPWEYNFSIEDSRSIEFHYPTMALESICKMKIPYKENTVLFLWVPMPKLNDGLMVIKEWGFEYKTGMVWLKDKIGMGYYVRSRHELLLIATKGKPEVPLEQNRPESLISSPRIKHSGKPDIAEMIEKMYPFKGKSYIELFARIENRNKRPNWIYWGKRLDNGNS